MVNILQGVIVYFSVEFVKEVALLHLANIPLFWNSKCGFSVILLIAAGGLAEQYRFSG